MTTNDFTVVILAGGAGRRLGGKDKGLVPYQGRCLIEYSLALTADCCCATLISANRNLATYATYGHPVIPDLVSSTTGPLSGLQACATSISTDKVLVVACDMPSLTTNLVIRLQRLLSEDGCDAAVYQQAETLQCSLFAIRQTCLSTLTPYLEQGQRSIKGWLQQQQLTIIPATNALAFQNCNTPADLISNP
jgi:molybdopterin-guanine dinucleotide biosynthesis protein A